MKKCKILSAVLSLAMSVSLITPMTHAYGGETMYEQNFENVALYTNGWDWEQQNFEIVNDADKGKVLHAKKGTANVSIIEKNLSDVTLSGKVKIAVDFKHMYNTGSFSNFFVRTTAGELALLKNQWENNYNQNQWCHADIVIDTATGVANYTFTKANGNTTTKEQTLKAVSGAKVQNIALQSYGVGGVDAEAYWANISISSYEPFGISDDCVAIYNGSEKQDKNSVAKASNKIEFDFSKAIDEESIADKITVTNTDTNKKVAFTGAVSGTKYVMTLTDALKYEGNYSVKVAAGVKSTDGDETAKEYTYTFKTASNLLYSQRFDLTTENLKSTGWDWETTGTPNFEIVKDADKGNTLHAKTGTANMTILDSKLSGLALPGKTRVSIDFKHVGNTGSSSLMVLKTRNGDITLLRNSWESLYNGNGEFLLGGTYGASQWCHADAVLDTTTGSVSYMFTKANGDVKTYETIINNVKGAVLTGISLKSYGTSAEAYWANIEIASYEEPFALTADSVAIYEGETKQNNQAVAKTADKIELDFGSAINAETIKNAVTITKTDDNSTVAFSGAVSGSKYVMTLNTPLQFNGNYKINVAKTVENTEGNTLEAPFEATFKVVSSVLYTQDFTNASSSDFTSFKESTFVNGDETYGTYVQGTVAKGSEVIIPVNVPVAGEVKISADVKMRDTANNGTTKLNLNTDKGDVWGLFFNGSGLFRTWDNDLKDGMGGLDVNKWYHAEMIYNFETGTVSYLLTDSFGTVAINKEFKNPYQSERIKGAKKINSIVFSGWNGNESTEAHQAIDNIRIEYYANKPTLSNESIAFYVGDVKEVSNTTVAPTVNKIEVDFGTSMEKSTLTNGVTLSKDGSPVAFTGTLSGTKYIMTVSGLEKGGQYTLSVAANVENILGDKLGKAFTKAFSVNEGAFSAELAGLTQGGQAVTTFEGLTGEQKAVANIDVTNTTGEKETAKVIWAFYNGTKLEKVQVNDIEFKAEDTQKTVTDEFTLPTLTGISEVSVMLWDSFTGLTPLCDNISLIKAQAE